jgi:hypothetical protein
MSQFDLYVYCLLIYYVQLRLFSYTCVMDQMFVLTNAK